MLKLFQPKRNFDAPNPSPFCTKLETLLRMKGIEYEIVPITDPRKAPTGKMPWIDDEGTLVGDTTLIAQYLETSRGIDFDEGLDDRQRADNLAYIRLIEEHLYWVLVHSRWIEDDSWPITRQAFFGAIPAPIRGFISNMIRTGVAKSLHGHGLGRHDYPTRYEFGAADLSALSTRLGDAKYFGGDKPCTLDAVAFGLLVNLVRGPHHTPLQKQAKGHQNLVAFAERFGKEYFPEIYGD